MKKLIALAMLAISSASAQEQRVILFGDVVGFPGQPPGTTDNFDVLFSWNLSTDTASSHFGVPFCDASLGPQTASATLQGNEIIASGTCTSGFGLVNWDGFVDEQTPSDFPWIGSALAAISAPTAAPEPGTLALLALAGLGLGFTHRRRIPRAR